MRARITALAVVAALFVYAYVAPGVRREFIRDVITWDAEPSEPVELPGGNGVGLAPIPRTRVILIDGLSAQVARTLPNWTAMCKRGLALDVDVGFPTVSLPVEVSLWTGLTQQQTGIMFRSDRPLVPPLSTSIPARVPGSVAVAEDHGFIVRSLGFSRVLPAAAPGTPAKDLEPEPWKAAWQAAALDAVRSDARLAFVHVLRVDTWGHKKGRDSAEYRNAATEADEILATMVAAAPDARWFLLSDHGHLATGGHGGEDRSVRHVEHCIVGPGVVPGRAGLVHVVDMSRAIADSVGIAADRASRGRALSVARADPLDRDQAVPPLALGTGAIAIFILALGVAASVWSIRRWWLAPWWFVVGALLFYLLNGEPTLSMPMVYAPTGERLREAWEPALLLAAAATYVGMGRTTLLRVLVAQLALPFACLAAAITACGGWAPLLGAEVAPVVPHYTAYTSPLLLLTAHGAAAVGLAVLARTVLAVFDRPPPPETPRTEPSAG